MTSLFPLLLIIWKLKLSCFEIKNVYFGLKCSDLTKNQVYGKKFEIVLEILKYPRKQSKVIKRWQFVFCVLINKYSIRLEFLRRNYKKILECDFKNFIIHDFGFFVQ